MKTAKQVLKELKGKSILAFLESDEAWTVSEKTYKKLAKVLVQSDEAWEISEDKFNGYRQAAGL